MSEQRVEKIEPLDVHGMEEAARMLESAVFTAREPTDEYERGWKNALLHNAGVLRRAAKDEAQRSMGAPVEPPPGYRTGRRKLVYNKDTKQIDVVVSESGFVVESFDPPFERPLP